MCAARFVWLVNIQMNLIIHFGLMFENYHNGRTISNAFIFYLKYSSSLLTQTFLHSGRSSHRLAFSGNNQNVELLRAKIELNVCLFDREDGDEKVRKYLFSLIHCLKFQSINKFVFQRNKTIGIWYSYFGCTSCDFQQIPFKSWKCEQSVRSLCFNTFQIQCSMSADIIVFGIFVAHIFKGTEKMIW